MRCPLQAAKTSVSRHEAAGPSCAYHSVWTALQALLSGMTR